MTEMEQLYNQIGQLQQALHEVMQENTNVRNMAAQAVAAATMANQNVEIAVTQAQAAHVNAQQQSRNGALPKLSSHFREYLQEDGQNTALWNATLRQEMDRYGLLPYLDVPGYEAGSAAIPVVRSMLLQSMEPGVRLHLEGAMALSNKPGGVLQQHPQVLYSSVMNAWNAVAQQKRHVLHTRLNTFAMQAGEDVGKFFIRLAKLHSEMLAAGMNPPQSDLVEAAIRATTSLPQYSTIAAAVIAAVDVTTLNLSTLQQRFLAWEDRLRGHAIQPNAGEGPGPTPMVHAAVTETPSPRPPSSPEAPNAVEELLAALRSFSFRSRGRGTGWRGGRGAGGRGGGRGAARGAERRCYTCGKIGHLSWECPTRNAVAEE
jgi:hypothetical protein